MPRLWLNKALSFNRNVHLGYFVGSFPFPSLQFVLTAMLHHAAHHVALTSWFLELQSELDQEPDLALTYKGKPRVRPDKAWPNSAFRHCKQRIVRLQKTDTQPQPLLKPGFSEAPIRT